MNRNDDDFLTRLAEPLRAPVETSAGFEARVMESVSAVWRDPARTAADAGTVGAITPEGVRRGPARSGVLSWVTRPRVLRLSPLAGIAAAAGIAIAVLAVDRAGSPRVEPQRIAAGPSVVPAASVADTVKLVQFVLVAPAASSVSVVGDFNDWDPTATPLREAADAGVWTVTVPLAEGRHQYVFMVNGSKWTPDPAAPRAVEDSFGMPNSVITVGESST